MLSRPIRHVLACAALAFPVAVIGVIGGCGIPAEGTDDAAVMEALPDLLEPLLLVPHDLKNADLAPPAPICKKPGAPKAPWFNDVTAQVLPGATDPKTAPTGNTLQAGDLDGDGYPDLIDFGGEGFPNKVPASTCSDSADTPGAPDAKSCAKDSDCKAGQTCLPVSARDIEGYRRRMVFMNRPDPADPTGKHRVFVDFTQESHLFDTRGEYFTKSEGGVLYSGAYGPASIGDVDNDGDNDVVLGPGTVDSIDPGVVALNDGFGHFHIADSGDLEKTMTGFSPATATLADFNADGQLDYLPGTFVYPPPNGTPPVLFHGNGGGKFTNVAANSGLPTECFSPAKAAPTCSPNYGLTACDIDMDGDQDILFASYGREPNQVWINDNGKYTEVGVQTGIAYDDRTDFSDDQSYRCYCANRPGKCVPQPPDPYDPGYCTFAGGKDGRGWFPGQSDTPWRLGGNNYSLVCADVDNDGDMDIMTSTIRHADVGSCSDPSELCINDTPPGMPLGKFRRPGGKVTGIDRSAFEMGFNWNQGDLTAQMMDVDNDGLKDVYICDSDYPGDHGWLFHQKPDHTFEDSTIPSKLGQKESHGIAFFDMDKDGDLDVAIGTSTFRGGAANAYLKIYENLVGQDQNWVQIQLVGLGKGATNRTAIGALVKVTAGGVTQMMEINGGHSASATENEHILTFGLGANCTIEKVEVRWLDGKKTVSTYKDVRANYRVRLTEGADGVVEYLQ